MDTRVEVEKYKMPEATRGRTHRFIRQLHLWIGAWGALAAILFGFSGFIQNHRAVLKLPQGDSTELSKVELEVPEAARETPESLRDWLRDTQHLPIDNVRAQGPAPGEMNGQRIRQPSRWMFTGGDVRNVWQADYSPGNVTIQVRNTQQSPIATLIRLHKGVGANIAWILLADTFALSLVTLGITGIVMWARGRSWRQMIFSVFAVAVLVLAIVAGSVVI
jgi:uncharacterized protein